MDGIALSAWTLEEDAGAKANGRAAAVEEEGARRGAGEAGGGTGAQRRNGECGGGGGGVHTACEATGLKVGRLQVGECRQLRRGRWSRRRVRGPSAATGAQRAGFAAASSR